MCSYKPDQAIEDPHRLGTRKHCRTLIPMSEEARKPRFAPKDADGALGGSFTAVRDCYCKYLELAVTAAQRFEIPLR